MNDKKAYRFARHQRLLSPKAFDAVYRTGARASTVHLSVRWLPDTSQAAQTEDPKGRLGITVAKRLLRRAVDRNAVKRVIRETYRRHAVANSTNDLVVGISTVKGLAKPRTRQGKTALRLETISLLKLQQKKSNPLPKRFTEPLVSDEGLT